MFISVYVSCSRVHCIVECRRFTLRTLNHIEYYKVERGNCVAWLLTSYTTKARIYIMGEVSSSTIIIYYGEMHDGYTELDAEAREMAQAPPATVVGAYSLQYILYTAVHTYTQQENGGNYN